MIFDLVSIGNINVDLSFRVGRMPRKDSEVFSEDFLLSHGGSAANLAYAAGKLGLRVAMVGCVGNDPMGREGVAELEEAGVDCSRVLKVEGEGTGAVCVIVDSRGSRSMIAYRGANANLVSAVGQGIPRAKIVHMSNVGMAVVKIVRSLHPGGTLSLDPGGGAAELGLELLDGLDMIMLNEDECSAITRLPHVEGGEMLAERVGTVVIKRGKNGAMAIKGVLRSSQPPFHVKVVDSTGAGDAFDAGFILGVLEDKDLESCVRLGQAVAAVKIGGFGARSNLPSKSELMNFLKERGI